MKIAFITSEFPKLSETFILNQITGLLDRGHSVEIFANRHSNEKTVHNDVKKYNLLDHTYYIEVPSKFSQRLFGLPGLLATTKIKCPATLLRSLNIFKYKRLALSLKLLYKSAPFMRDFDIIHCHFGPNGNWGAILKELGVKAKLVTTFHGYDIRMGLEKGGQIYRNLFERGDCFISISDYNYSNLVRFGLDKEKIVNLPVGIDLGRFPDQNLQKTLTPGSPIKIVTVARLVEEKGLHYGILAIHEVLQEMPELKIKYFLVGEGPLKDELTTLIEKLQLGKTVNFLGSLNQDDVVNTLMQSHIFLLPSVAEALPICLMEAQAAFLPVVATDVGSVKQLALDGSAGFIASPGNVEDLAAKLKTLLKHPEKWSEMGQSGRKHVENYYDIDKLNDKLVQIYHALLS